MSDSHENAPKTDEKSAEKPVEKPEGHGHAGASDGHGAGHGDEKKKSASTAKVAQLKEGARAAALKQKENAGTLLRGVRSQDPSVRRMTWIFLGSLLGAMVLLGAAAHRFYQGVAERRKVEAERDAAKTMTEFLTRQAEERRRRVFSSNLGEFSFELSQGGGRDGEAATQALGVTGLAEAEIIVECDTAETCEYIDKSLPVIRDQVTAALTEVDREELIHREGKRRIRKAIVDRINQVLPRGRVMNAFFGRLVID
jgi:hypothetical protein